MTAKQLAYANSTSGTWRARGSITQAEQRYEHALQMARRSDGECWDTIVLSALTRLRYDNGDFAGASAAADETLALCAVRDDPSTRARTLAIRSRLAALAHKDALADALMAECLQLQQRLRAPLEHAYAHLMAAETALDRRRLDEAARHLDEGLRLAAQVHYQLALARGLEGVAELLASAEPEAALQLGGTAASIRAAHGLTPNPIEAARLERWLDVARAAVGAEEAERMQQVGRARSAADGLAQAHAACAAMMGAPDSVQPVSSP